MVLPLSPNITCDIYRQGTAPPAAPTVAAVGGFLRPDFRGGREAGDFGPTRTWTHLLLLDVSVDVRDSYMGNLNHMNQDTLYIPDQNGTAFLVTFVERVNRGSAGEHKRVFLDRQTPTWPTNNV